MGQTESWAGRHPAEDGTTDFRASLYGGEWEQFIFYAALATARKQADEAYHDLVAMLNAAALMDESEYTYEELFNQINELINYNRLYVVPKKGSKSEDEAGGDSEDAGSSDDGSQQDDGSSDGGSDDGAGSGSGSSSDSGTGSGSGSGSNGGYNFG